MLQTLEKLGFDTGKGPFLIRTALAVCVAILLAFWLGLDHPQWAGMSVWIASLPVRGSLLAKGAARLAGSVVGALVAIGMVWLAHDNIAALVVGLSLWVALCVLVAHVARGYLTYVCMLAGYSAALVALVDTTHHDQILLLGMDRLATAVLGVLVAIAASWYFAGRDDPSLLRTELQQVTLDVLQGLLRVIKAERHDDQAQQRAISRLAALDAMLEARGIDPGLSRQQARVMRRLIPLLVSIAIWRRAGSVSARAAIQVALERVITSFSQHGFGEQAGLALAELLQVIRVDARLGIVMEHLQGLQQLNAALSRADDQVTPQVLNTGLVLHRDWVGGRQAAFRTLVVMLSVGAVWVVSGLQLGAYMLLGVAVMTSLFSTFDAPRQMMRMVFVGQILGAVAAMTCHWLLWPFASSPLVMVLMIFPFVVLGIPISAHRRLSAAAFDYNLVLLLMLQPVFPLHGQPLDTLILSLAVVTAPLIAMAAYGLIYPVSSQRRAHNLQRMMLNELAPLAQKSVTAEQRQLWRNRLFHRMLHLVRCVDAGGSRPASATDWAVAMLRLELLTDVLQKLDLVLADTATRRAVREALEAIVQLGESVPQPQQLLDALRRAHDQLQRQPLDHLADAIELLERALAAVTDVVAMFPGAEPAQAAS